MTDADLILALRQRGWTDCADAIEAGQQLKPIDRQASELQWAIDRFKDDSYDWYDGWGSDDDKALRIFIACAREWLRCHRQPLADRGSRPDGEQQRDGHEP